MLPKLSSLIRLIRKLRVLLRPYGIRKFVLVAVTTVIQGALQVVGVISIFPFFAVASDPAAFRESRIGQILLDRFQVDSDRSLLLYAATFSIAMLVLTNVFNLTADFVRSRFAQDLGHWLRMRLFARILSRPWGFFLEANVSVLLKKIGTDVYGTISGVVQPMLEATSRMLAAILMVLLLFLVQPWIAIACAITIAGYYLTFFRFLQKHRRNASMALKAAERGTGKYVLEALGGVKALKIHGAERTFLQGYEHHSRSRADMLTRIPVYGMAPKYIFEPLAFGGIILVIMVFVRLNMGISEVLPTLALIGFAGYRLMPAAQIIYAQLTEISSMQHTLDEVYEEFIDCADEDSFSLLNPSLARGKALKFRSEICFDHVTFSYSKSREPIIDDLSFTVRKNQAVGIVGPTGSGKSTLVDLLMGLHQPTSGAILLDGAALSGHQIRDWQANIGYVPQDVFLLNDTIVNNIAFGIPPGEIDHARVRKAADAAQILEFIERELSNGFETSVGDRGVRLSGGQRQRIALARALYHEPEVLVLDEATSALDNETERAVVEAISRMQGKVTMLVVAHRLSTLERCDYILDLGSLPRGQRRM